METIQKALAKQGTTTKNLERWKDEMPGESEMVPKDKYSIFDRKARGYRKNIRRKWLRSCHAPAHIIQAFPSGRELVRG